MDVSSAGRGCASILRMHVALLADESWVDQELPVFRHLIVGLIDETVRVVQVVPPQLTEDEVVSFAMRVDWAERGNGWLRPLRHRRLGDCLAPLEVDLVHSLGPRTWTAAVRVGRRLGVPIVLGLAHHRELKWLRWLQRHCDPSRFALSAATGPLATAARQRLPEDAVIEHITPGVHPRRQLPASQETDTTLCVVVSSTGRFDAPYEQLLDALSLVVREHGEVQLFFDGPQAQQHHLWRGMQQRDLLEHATLMPHRLGRRLLLRGVDLVIQPHALGGARSLLLRAMAAGLPVLTLNDPWVDYLLDEQTAWLLDEPSVDGWKALLRRVIRRPDEARELGSRAREWISERARASQYVGRTLSVYRRMTGESIQFPA